MMVSRQLEMSKSMSKTTKMKELVVAIQEYLLTKREDSIVIINKHLQSLSVTIDLSIFDPHTNIASQFYVSLYQLMKDMEPNSTYAWKCVDVLSNACKNPSARYSLIHTYQYIPCLSRLLSDQLSTEKKIHILRLMQDLTCGIKISWQIPHLPTLMATLAQWIKTSNPDIVSLALGTLVNLCYKNLPAVYTLVGKVDVREMIEICVSITSTPIIALHTCKLFIILDYANGDIPEAMLFKLTKISFESIVESYRSRDLFFLRQVVEFVLDVAKNNSFHSALERHDFSQQLNELVTVIDNRDSMDTGDNYRSTCPECIGLVFEFLNFFVEIQLPAITQLYPTLIELALNWIHTDLVSTQALSILKSIAVNLDQTENDILAPLVQGLPIFIAGIDCNKTEESMCIEDVKKVLGLLQLIKVMVRVDAIRANVLEEFHVESIEKVFGAFLIDESKDLRNNGHLETIEHVNMYTQAVALTHELAQHDGSWSMFLVSLLQNKQIHLVLAQCLYESSEHEKNVVFGLLGHPSFPSREVAKAMCLLQPIATSQQEKRRNSPVQELNLPVLSVSQIQGIDEVLSKLDKIVQSKGDVSVLTSDVMELYEYKLASMASAERNAMAGVAAASERCTLLQHRNAQLTSELNRSHQLLYRSQQSCEHMTKENNSLSEELTKSKTDVKVYEEKLKLAKQQVTDSKKKLSEAEVEISSLKQVVTKVQNSATRLEQNLIKKDELILKSNNNVEHLNSVIKTLENKIGDLETKLGKVTKELNEKRKIMETITKMALNSQT